MNFQTLILSTLTLLILIGCANTTEKKESTNTTEEQQANDTVHNNLPILDTLKTTYPIQIGNDKGLITVHEISRAKPVHFIIDLDYRNQKVFSVYVDKHVVIDSIKRPFFLDTLHLDYTHGAILTSVKYEAIRGSTLYFAAILENKEQQKAVEGRFNVFYNPSRKGQIYGWISDTLYNTVSVK